VGGWGRIEHTLLVKYGADASVHPRTAIRKCQVCSLPEEQRDAFERAMRGEPQVDKSFLTVQATERKYKTGIQQPLLSRHKKECMGVYSPRMKGVPSTAVVVPAMVVRDIAAWVPTEVTAWTRGRIRSAIAELDAKIAEGATAAFFAVRLEHFKLLLGEAEKTGGTPLDRQKSYLDEVRAKLESKGKREITRTMTVTEKITEGDVEPACQEVTILSA
jgi:hypothetical protein